CSQDMERGFTSPFVTTASEPACCPRLTKHVEFRDTVEAWKESIEKARTECSCPAASQMLSFDHFKLLRDADRLRAENERLRLKAEADRKRIEELEERSRLQQVQQLQP
ncbi:hypothetical protein PFISCL1PPCAC_9289, partial [Pristionchus fissidentatus]